MTMQKTLVSTFRWIAYIILILLVPPILQTFAVNAGESGVWWIWFPVYLFFGWWLVLVLTFAVASICPAPRITNLIYLGIFLVGEVSYLYFKGAGSNALEIVLRLGTDLQIILGIMAGAFAPYSYQKGNAT